MVGGTTQGPDTIVWNLLSCLIFPYPHELGQSSQENHNISAFIIELLESIKTQKKCVKDGLL